MIKIANPQADRIHDALGISTDRANEFAALAGNTVETWLKQGEDFDGSMLADSFSQMAKTPEEVFLCGFIFAEAVRTYNKYN